MMNYDELQYIRAKVDRMDERLDSIDKTLTLNTQSLVEHVKRTNILEQKLEPVERHVALVNATAKVLSVLFSILLGAKALGLF